MTIPPQFGRAWRLEIADAAGNDLVVAYSDSYERESLQIEFDVSYGTNSGYAYADIVIYNLNGATEQAVLQQGQRVTLYGGYQTEPYGIIFQGPIFQPLFERVNVTDYKLTLHCIVGVEPDTNNFINDATGPGLTQRDVIARMAAKARTPIPVQSLDSNEATEVKYPRGQVLFGANPVQQIADIAKDANLNTWITQLGVHVRDLSQADAVPTYTFGVGTGLIGTPQQTQDGITCTVLLDARISLREQVKLDQSQIRQLPRVQGSFPPLLAEDGVYIVFALRHVGSSRGNAWQTELICGSSIGGKLGLQL